MRYGLQFADGDPFPKDAEFGVQLQDEAVTEVPEPCPEAVADAGTPAFVRWDWLNGTFYQGVLAGFELCVGSAPVTVSVHGRLPDLGDNFPEVALVPICDRGGHAMRIVIEEGWTWDVFPDVGRVILSTTPLVHTSIMLSWGAGGWGFNAAATGRIKCQLDLTDAAPGFETWTDFGCPIALVQ